MPNAWALRWLLRILPFVVVMAISLAAFNSGVDLSERPGIPQTPWPTQLYYATGLFVLGGLDLGVPTGGDSTLRVALWGCYFLAPLATTTLLAEGLIRLIRPKWWVRRRRQDHVIVVGLGRFGTLLVEQLIRTDPKCRVLIVEKNSRRASVEEARQISGVEVLIGDISHRSTQDELRLDRARGLALMTENDLINLEAAWDLSREFSDLPFVVHVSNIGMLRRVDGIDSPAHFQFFNAHRVAAEHLFETVLADRFSQTPGRDVVVIGGFGRFGQTIVERLQTLGRAELQKILIVDQEAEKRAELFSDEVGFGEGIDWECIGADMSDPRTWSAVDAAMVDHQGVIAFVLGTDDDALNLRLAMSIRTRHPSATITLRCFHRSVFNAELAESLQLTLVSLEDLVREAVDEQLLAHLRVTGD